MEASTPYRKDLSWAGPQVIINLCRWLLWFIDFANTFSGLVAEATGDKHFTKWLVFDPLHDFTPSCIRATLHAVLDDYAFFAVFLCSLYKLAAFPDVVGNRFFNINVLSVLGGKD